MRIKSKSHKSDRAGFVIGELLIGLLLLAVAVSSLAALMYSVSRRPGASRAGVECVSGRAAGVKCTPQSGAGGASKLLRSGCAMRAGMLTAGCDDSPAGADSSDETIVRSRTDSVSLELLARKQKALRDSGRPDRGFIR